MFIESEYHRQAITKKAKLTKLSTKAKAEINDDTRFYLINWLVFIIKSCLKHNRIYNRLKWVPFYHFFSKNRNHETEIRWAQLKCYSQWSVLNSKQIHVHYELNYLTSFKNAITDIIWHNSPKYIQRYCTCFN